MRSVVGKVVLGVLVAAVSTSVSAQWPKYTTPDVPRLADGQPNLTAPAPRTADGKVDFSGIWEIVFGGGGGRGRGAEPAPTPPPDPNATPVSQFFEVAGRGYPLPLQPWAAELRASRVASSSKDNPDAHCLPIGITQLHNHPQPRKIIQTPSLIVILYEANGGVREIFLDGRPAPAADAEPFWWGYSRGRWDGDTLVVESTKFKDGGWLDVNGAPLTDQGRIIERFRRPTVGTLEIDVTNDDPKAYTRPWTVRVNQRLLPDTSLIEFVCLENNQFNPATGSRRPRQ